MTATLWRLPGCRRGVAAMEFALVAPVLVALWLGLAEVSTLHLVARKANVAAQSVADLIAQERCLSDDQIDDIILASKQIMRPYPTAELVVEIFSIERDEDGDLAIGWPYPDGATTAIPEAAQAEEPFLIDPGESVIYVRLAYPYKAILNSGITDRTISEQAFARPRLVKTVSKPCP